MPAFQRPAETGRHRETKRPRNGLIVVELHVDPAATMAAQEQGLRIAKHAGQRNHRTNSDPPFAAVMYLHYRAAAVSQVSYGRIDPSPRCYDLYTHYRFKHSGACLDHRLAKAGPRGGIEADNVRVHVVIGAVDQSCPYAEDRETSDNPTLPGSVESGDDAGQVFEWHGAVRSVLELEASMRRYRLEPDSYPRELSVSHQGMITLGRAADGLAVRGLRVTHVDLEFELGTQVFSYTIEMSLARSPSDDLATLAIDAELEKYVFPRNCVKRRLHFGRG
jgi:hypothetical protein